MIALSTVESRHVSDIVNISKSFNFKRIVSLTRQNCSRDFIERTFKCATLALDFNLLEILIQLAEFSRVSGPGKG